MSVCSGEGGRGDIIIQVGALLGLKRKFLHASWSHTSVTSVALYFDSTSLLNPLRINASEMNKNEEERKRIGEGREEEGGKGGRTREENGGGGEGEERKIVGEEEEEVGKGEGEEEEKGEEEEEEGKEREEEGKRGSPYKDPHFKRIFLCDWYLVLYHVIKHDCSQSPGRQHSNNYSACFKDGEFDRLIQG